MSKPYTYCPVKSVTLRPDAVFTGAVPVPEPGDQPAKKAKTSPPAKKGGRKNAKPAA